MYIMEMYFTKPYDFLNRTVTMKDKRDSYFDELMKLTDRERELLIKTIVKEAE